MDQENLNSLIAGGDPEELDRYLGEIFGKENLKEIILGLLRLRLPDEVATRRAQMVVEDMAKIGFHLQPEVQRGIAGRLHECGFRVPIHYDIPNTTWTVNHADHQHAIDGTHLSKGDLVRLSKVCEIGRTLLCDDWPGGFARQLLIPGEHLDTVNEIWWLSRFKNPLKVEKLDANSKNLPSPDWSFSVQSLGTVLRLRVEVKRRSSDIKRYLAIRDRTPLFDEISRKFSQRSLTELNVAVVTTYSQIDTEVMERTKTWFEDESNLDCIILWSEESFKSPPLAFECKGDIHHLIRDCLNEPDEEDTSGVAMIRHLKPNYPGLPRIA